MYKCLPLLCVSVSVCLCPLELLCRLACTKRGEPELHSCIHPHPSLTNFAFCPVRVKFSTCHHIPVCPFRAGATVMRAFMSERMDLQYTELLHHSAIWISHTGSPASMTASLGSCGYCIEHLVQGASLRPTEGYEGSR